ncbi:MAG: hypothetical protein IPG66_16870 [Hydrogenophilales bacterium]|nr:hypothetical protein [Hydrogenophilales bacterium]
MSKTEPLNCVAELSALVGEVFAGRILEKYAGAFISFQLLRREIADLTDLNASKLLAFHYGAPDVYIPMRSAEARAKRNRAVRARFDELTKTLSARAAVRKIVSEFKCSERRVWYWLKETDE